MAFLEDLVAPFPPAAADEGPATARGAGSSLYRRRPGSGAGATGDRLAYLDPPYNQHRYAGNYHVWETLVAWDSPDHYGVACKRWTCELPPARSVFNRRRQAPAAMTDLVRSVRSEVVVISASDEGWMSGERPGRHGRGRGAVDRLGLRLETLRGRADRHPRPTRGRKVGRSEVSTTSEYLIVAGSPAKWSGCPRVQARPGSSERLVSR